jgi:hypothetical protein
VGLRGLELPTKRLSAASSEQLVATGVEVSHRQIAAPCPMSGKVKKTARPTSQSPGDARCSSWLAKRYLKILVPPRLTFSRFDHIYGVALVIAIQRNFDLLF